VVLHIRGSFFNLVPFLTEQCSIENRTK